MLALLLIGCRADKTFAPPTAIYFGDSITLGIAGPTRYDLAGYVDFRHDAWEAEDIAPQNTLGFFAEVAERGRNNGCSATLVHAMTERLPGAYYDVLVMEVGAHDFQHERTKWDGDLFCGRIPPEVYRDHLESAAVLAKAHAAIVVMHDIEPIPMVGRWVVGEEVPYNQVIHEVAREHGFYMFEPEWPTARYAQIHFTQEGYEALGQQLATCVSLALNQQESDRCHH